MRAAVQAFLIALLALAALLCVGLGSTVGVVSQSLASKLIASAQYLQRQSGSSLVYRAARQALPAVAADVRTTDALGPLNGTHVDGAIPVSELAPPRFPARKASLPDADTGPILRSRHWSPPSRAPPRLA